MDPGWVAELNRAKNVLVTGGAGFIGSHLVSRLLKSGASVTAIDNYNDFYDPRIKHENVRMQQDNPRFRFIQADVRDADALYEVFDDSSFDTIVHLAAMAGVRPSLMNPSLYMDVNVVGTQRLLDAIRHSGQKPLFILGSSSSVYGQRTDEKFAETDPANRPLSPYAASKMASEAVVYSAHHIDGLPALSLRFFTVYGPRQRPDLAIHKFCDLIHNDRPLELFGDGTSKRDYTYVEDIVNGVEAAIERDWPGYEVINLGRSEPVLLKDVVCALESSLGKKAKVVHKEVQTGDVPNTYANIDKARKLLGYEPKTSLADGVDKFVRWYLEQPLARPTAGTRK